MADFVALMGHTFPDFKNSNLVYLAANQVKNNKKFGVDGNENDLANSENQQLKEIVDDLTQLYHQELNLIEFDKKSQEYNILSRVTKSLYEKVVKKIDKAQTLDYKVSVK